MRQLIINALAEAVKMAYTGLSWPDISLFRPTDETHGDYSSNIALILAGEIGEPSFFVAQKIVSHFPAVSNIAKVEAVAPGFINFYLDHAYFVNSLAKEQPISAGEDKKIIFEFGQPNTHKVPHIGHLFSYCYGESCVRLLKAVGNTVFAANYQGDVGLHVAKCLWAYRKNVKSDPLTLAEKTAYLQDCYQQGSAAYTEDDSAKQEIEALNRMIYRRDALILSDWEKTRGWSLEYYRQFEKELCVHYDQLYLESQTSEPGLAVVKENIGTVFEEDQGAVIFRGEKYGLHTRVFINKFEDPTYEAKDIGLIVCKTKDFEFDLSITETGNDQSEYWRVEKKVIELLFPPLTGKIATLHHGMINLKSGKMASRTGNIITAFSLVAAVKERVLHHIEENRDYQPQEKEQIASSVAIGAIKYAFLKSTAGKDISFDIDSSIAFDGNSGPYLQYTHARCRSVLAKAKAQSKAKAKVKAKAGESPVSTVPINLSTKLTSEELAVLRYLDRFGETVVQAAADFAPHVLGGYLFELAQCYSSFYNECPILTEEKNTQNFRLALTKKTAVTLAKGLELLGIDAPDRI